MDNERFEYVREVPYILNSPAGIKCQEFNNLKYDDNENKKKILKELFGSIGSDNDITIENGFNCDLGFNIHVGNRFYSCFNFTCLDVAEVRIGDNCMIGPNVSIFTTGHNIEPEDRDKSGFGLPITIGNNVWIGGNSVILPGVTIGDGSVIAAGSIVTKNVPQNVVYGGNPAKKIRDLKNNLKSKL